MAASAICIAKAHREFGAGDGGPRRTAVRLRQGGWIEILHKPGLLADATTTSRNGSDLPPRPPDPLTPNAWRATYAIKCRGTAMMYTAAGVADAKNFAPGRGLVAGAVMDIFPEPWERGDRGGRRLELGVGAGTATSSPLRRGGRDYPGVLWRLKEDPAWMGMILAGPRLRHWCWGFRATGRSPGGGCRFGYSWACVFQDRRERPARTAVCVDPGLRPKWRMKRGISNGGQRQPLML